MTFIFDILLFLAFVSTIVGTVVTRQPSGAEGPIGAWLLLVFPCLFVATLVFLLGAKGALNFIPGGRLVQLAIAAGILISFSTTIFGTIDRHSGVIQGLLIGVPYLILAGGAATVHHTELRDPRLGHWVAAILLGGAAMAGWGLAGKGIFLFLQRGLERSARQAQKEMEQEEQYKQKDAVEFPKLDDSPSLKTLLRFTFSRNDQVQGQARLQARNFPELDDRLMELLDEDCEDAISYIAYVYENPPVKLAPAWRKMLERKLKAWNSLQYDEHAGTWEQNLKAYFVGAQKLQLAGGSLRTELLLWHQHLQKCKGLENLTVFVKRLL